MADLEKQKIQQDLEQIRDERRKAANTAERIGQALLELLHFIEESGNVTSLENMMTRQTGLSHSIKVLTA